MNLKEHIWGIMGLAQRADQMETWSQRIRTDHLMAHLQGYCVLQDIKLCQFRPDYFRAIP